MMEPAPMPATTHPARQSRTTATGRNRRRPLTGPRQPLVNPALHRAPRAPANQRGARPTRREEGAYRTYATGEQRSQAGRIAARMQRGLHLGR